MTVVRCADTVVDGAHEVAGHGYCVTTQIRRDSVAGCGIEAPCIDQRVGIVHVVLEVPSPVPEHLADLPGLDDLSCQRSNGVLEVVEPDHRPGARGLGGSNHACRAFGGWCQWLLAVHGLPSGDGGQGHLLVEMVWARDVDDVDGGVGHQRPPITGRAGEAEVGGGCGRGGVVEVGEDLEPWWSPKAEDGRCGAIRESVHLSDESAPDETDADAVHLGVVPPWGGPVVAPTTSAGGSTTCLDSERPSSTRSRRSCTAVWPSSFAGWAIVVS